jgi:hypothetical protein
VDVSFFFFFFIFIFVFKVDVVKTIEFLGPEGESTNEKWTIFLGYQGSSQ